MRDNLDRYRAIRDALTRWYPGQPPGTVARHWSTRAARISGIVGSKRTPLPSVAPPSLLTPSPRAVSNAWPAGSTTSASWRRGMLYRMASAY